MNTKILILKEGLKLISLEIEELKVKLPDFVDDIIDDISNQFHDSYILIPQLMDENLLSFDAVKHILHVHVRLESNWQDEKLTTLKAFTEDKNWKFIREHAKAALLEIEKTH